MIGISTLIHGYVPSLKHRIPIRSVTACWKIPWPLLSFGGFGLNQIAKLMLAIQRLESEEHYMYRGLRSRTTASETKNELKITISFVILYITYPVFLLYALKYRKIFWGKLCISIIPQPLTQDKEIFNFGWILYMLSISTMHSVCLACSIRHFHYILWPYRTPILVSGGGGCYVNSGKVLL